MKSVVEYVHESPDVMILIRRCSRTQQILYTIRFSAIQGLDFLFS